MAMTPRIFTAKNCNRHLPKLSWEEYDKCRTMSDAVVDCEGLDEQIIGRGNGMHNDWIAAIENLPTKYDLYCNGNRYSGGNRNPEIASGQTETKFYHRDWWYRTVSACRLCRTAIIRIRPSWHVPKTVNIIIVCAMGLNIFGETYLIFGWICHAKPWKYWAWIQNRAKKPCKCSTRLWWRIDWTPAPSIRDEPQHNRFRTQHSNDHRRTPRKRAVLKNWRNPKFNHDSSIAFFSTKWPTTNGTQFKFHRTIRTYGRDPESAPLPTGETNILGISCLNSWIVVSKEQMSPIKKPTSRKSYPLDMCWTMIKSQGIGHHHRNNI